MARDLFDQHKGFPRESARGEEGAEILHQTGREYLFGCHAYLPFSSLALHHRFWQLRELLRPVLDTLNKLRHGRLAHSVELLLVARTKGTHGPNSPLNALNRRLEGQIIVRPCTIALVVEPASQPPQLINRFLAIAQGAGHKTAWTPSHRFLAQRSPDSAQTARATRTDMNKLVL